MRSIRERRGINEKSKWVKRSKTREPDRRMVKGDSEKEKDSTCPQLSRRELQHEVYIRTQC
jgi:hypothetical protein